MEGEREDVDNGREDGVEAPTGRFSDEEMDELDAESGFSERENGSSSSSQREKNGSRAPEDDFSSAKAESTSNFSGSADLVDKLTEFLRVYYRDTSEGSEQLAELLSGYPSDCRSLHVSWNDLYEFDPDLADDYRQEPDQVHECFEEALRELDVPVAVDLGGAHIRVNLPRSADTTIRDIRASHRGKYQSVSGIVRKATDVNPKLTEAAFECQRCGTLTRIPQHGHDFQEPHECQGCERQGPFTINFDQSEFIDAQKIRVQESPEGLRGGETPQSIDIYIEDDITGEVTAGDQVRVSGVFHLEQRQNGQEKSSVFEMYVDGNEVVRQDTNFEEINITDADINRINEIAASENLYDRMVESVAPTIFGYEDQKLAMLMQLFAGVTKHPPDGSRIRGDFHILFIGDPGTGKSQLLQYVRNIAPRSVYTSGKGSSAAGLTASAVRDNFADTQQWTLEAGALVLADKGVAAVDEIDKMSPEDRSAMHEALEQQTVSVSKAGINATLKSRCSLLAAANPKYGRFDRYENVASQIDIEPALLSRFDLIFTFTDEADSEKDGDLATHILRTNRAGEITAQRTSLQNTTTTTDDEQKFIDNVDPEFDPEFLRKYIAHARTTTSPQLTDNAEEAIRDFYVDLRSQGENEDAPIPVTARKLEAIVRLAEASARIRLSNRATLADAHRAIDIIQSCLREIGFDEESGKYDADVVETGTSKSQRDRIKSIVALIDEIDSNTDGNGALTEDVLETASEMGMSENQAEHEIEVLKRRGQLVNPRSDRIRTT